MLMNSALKRILISTLTLFIFLFVYLFPIKDTSVDEDEILYTDAIKNPIYLLDENNYVSRINILSDGKDIDKNIKYIIASLTEGTEESNYIPNGFKAIIPSGTKLNNFTLSDDGLLKLDFSKDLLDVSVENEIKMIEAIIFSLCEFSEIKNIMIFIDGVKLIKLEKNNIILPNTFDKSFGINKMYDITSIKNVDQTIIYYLSKQEDYTYYIPISKYENSSYEKIEIIINNLQTLPYNHSNLISYLKNSVSLASYQILEESIILSFDNEIIADLSSENILEEVKYSIFLSLRDTYDVKSVIFESQNEKNVSVLLD